MEVRKINENLILFFFQNWVLAGGLSDPQMNTEWSIILSSGKNIYQDWYIFLPKVNCLLTELGKYYKFITAIFHYCWKVDSIGYHTWR